ncbi:acyl-CoA dehydrogenase family protein [Capillimicrobium parvum]|uniref:Acyl-CoA dehydrogenase YdbM n=1 Tax=Capillimicrobium parvum TaxID=2884022 RepID=A0A9E6XW53_9ACTN|nr:acyl-CoA dehydrogenase family protein [Capillimicrobium parvum]UGS35213.1 Putative acyl-CoA dehydrogenase YdbM [Capillimicrobium parvum]
MPLDLTARTPAGARLVGLAETLSGHLAASAGAHDERAAYPVAALDALRAAGYLAAPVPPELGGLGVASVHDVVVAASRLARGDASVAIGTNMHLVAVLSMVRRRQIAEAAGDARRAAAFGSSLAAAVRDGVVLAAAISEHGQDLTRPATVATRTERGWRVDGRKAFCTMSAAATHFYAAVTFADEAGAERYGYAQIAADAPGVRVHDDWDGLGMRASASHTVTFDRVELPAGALRGGFPAGDATGYMDRNLTAGLFHASASLGIAEAAHANALAALAGGNGAATHGRAGTLLADSELDLTAARGALGRAAMLIDDHHDRRPRDAGTATEIHALFAEAQATKALVGEAAPRVVDRAMALAGGAAYRSGHPIARALRDVRAIGFMHPLGANRAHEFVARAALGRDPELH